MIRLFKHYVPGALVVLGLIECALLFLSAELAWTIRAAQIGMGDAGLSHRLPELICYTVVIYVVMLGVGLYHGDVYRSLRMSAIRMAVACSLGIVALSVVFFLFPDVALWRSISLYAVILSFVSVLVARGIFSRLVGWRRFRRRVLVLGAGARAARVAELAHARGANFTVVGFVRMTDAAPVVQGAIHRSEIPSLSQYVIDNKVEEVVLAIEERRGSLPVDDLLKVKLEGARVSELSSFIERETGRVDLASVSPSWLIFSDGFLGSQQLAVVTKRMFDIVASAILLLISSPVLIVTAIAVKLSSPGPIFYLQERVGQFGRPFKVIKFRSMRVDAEKDGRPQWAQKGDPRVTTVGRIIRSTRIDEIPQIFNVFKGDMSFVGPRPERPFFVGDLAAQVPFYNERHVVKPGITGWAQLNYPYGASVEDARHKLEYDLYYVKNYSLFLDLLILIQTVRVVLWQDGVR